MQPIITGGIRHLQGGVREDEMIAMFTKGYVKGDCPQVVFRGITWAFCFLLWSGFILSSLALAEEEGRFTETRSQMVARQIRRRGVRDADVLRVMEEVPRQKFVPRKYLSRAYGDYPLPIGEGQTISQPYIVALMTELLELEPGDKVLEIGTGSGYQAAILAELVPEVYTIEIIGVLCERAKKLLTEEGYENIKLKHADGYLGWEEFAPFDAIIVTCAPDHIPQPLIRQLKDGGRMVIPVGMPGAYQTLWQIRKLGDSLKVNNVTTVRFVPLIREFK